MRRFDVYDVTTIAVIAALVVIALSTLKDYAIFNDEALQYSDGADIRAHWPLITPQRVTADRCPAWRLKRPAVVRRCVDQMLLAERGCDRPARVR